MTPEEFRENGHALIDWIVDYMEHVGEYPVLPEVALGETASKMPDRAPETSEPFASMLF